MQFVQDHQPFLERLNKPGGVFLCLIGEEDADRVLQLLQKLLEREEELDANQQSITQGMQQLTTAASATEDQTSQENQRAQHVQGQQQLYIQQQYCEVQQQEKGLDNRDLDIFSQISSNLGLDNLENCSLNRVLISTIFKSESLADLDLDNS